MGRFRLGGFRLGGFRLKGSRLTFCGEAGVHTNFCLFMPIYDYIGGTLDPRSWDLYFKAAAGEAVPQVLLRACACLSALKGRV